MLDDDPETALALAQTSIDAFGQRHARAWTEGMLAKLGVRADPDGQVAATVVGDLVALLQAKALDHTSTFRALTDAARGDDAPLRALVGPSIELDAWLRRWMPLHPDPEALAAATDGDLGPFERLLDAVTSPYVERAGFERYAEPAPSDFGGYRTFCGT